MRLIFIYGMPASGKLTVARELAGRTGFKLFHNHMVVDLLLSVFPFGSEAFVRLREEIWLRVFADAAVSGVEGMIFTFAPEPTVSAGFVERVVETVRRAGGSVDFVELVCGLGELRRRVVGESRRAFGKLADVELFDRLFAEGYFGTVGMPVARVRVDTETVGVEEAVERIVAGFGLG